MLTEWVGFTSLVISNAGINVGIYKYFSAKLGRIYERLDQVKERIDQDFVKKDMCKVMHENTAVNLSGLETRMVNRLEKLENKFDQIISLLTKK